MSYLQLFYNSSIIIKINIALFLFIYSISVFADAQSIPPEKEYITLDTGKVFNLKSKGEITYPDKSLWMMKAATLLAENLQYQGVYWSIKPHKNSANNDNIIHFLPLTEKQDIPYNKGDQRFEESYQIEIGKGVKIFVASKSGAIYAIQRLIELLKETHNLTPATIIDYPDFKWRGVMIDFKNTSCGDPLLMTNKELNTWVKCMDLELERYSMMRLNMIGVRSPIFHRLNNKDLIVLEQFFAKARNLNIEPVPFVASKLWGIPQDTLNVNAIEGIYHDNVPFKVVNERLVNQDNTTNLILDNRINGVKELSWSVSGRLSSAQWYEKSLKDDSNYSFLSIDVPPKNKPWQSRATALSPINSELIAVDSEKYYEFGLSIRSKESSKMRIKVILKQYDQNKEEIFQGKLNPRSFGAGKKWKKRWISVFIAEQAKFLSITILPQNRSNTTGTIDIDQAELRAMNGALVNVQDNIETSPVLYSEDGSVIYQRGKDYEFLSTAIQEWRDKDFENIKQGIIKIMPNSRISDGQKILVNFDTLPLEYRMVPLSRYSAASIYTYKEYQRIFSRLKLLSPKFVNISMDEHKGGLNRSSLSLQLGLDNRQLFIAYINGLDKLLRNDTEIQLLGSIRLKGVGFKTAKLVIWDDMLNPWHNGDKIFYQLSAGGQIGGTSLLEDNKSNKLSTNILLTSWWYRNTDENNKVRETPNAYNGSGYKFFFSPWYQRQGVLNWFMNKDVKFAEGVLATTWDGNFDALSLTACLAWNRHLINECVDINE